MARIIDQGLAQWIAGYQRGFIFNALAGNYDAAQAVEASRVADGVIMGASVVHRMIDGGAEAVGLFVPEVRSALDGANW